MKIRHSGVRKESVELQMTPMIDIVFQLLVFFIMSFKIVAQEGDFNIKMPLATKQQGLPDDSPVLPMSIQMRAGPDGRLVGSGGIIVNGELPFDTIDELHNYIIGVVGSDVPDVRNDAEVELDCDYDLQYDYVVRAITAVSGYVDNSTGQVVKLVEKIKFTPPKEPPPAE